MRKNRKIAFGLTIVTTIISPITLSSCSFIEELFSDEDSSKENFYVYSPPSLEKNKYFNNNPYYSNKENSYDNNNDGENDYYNNSSNSNLNNDYDNEESTKENQYLNNNYSNNDDIEFVLFTLTPMSFGFMASESSMWKPGSFTVKLQHESGEILTLENVRKNGLNMIELMFIRPVTPGKWSVISLKQEKAFAKEQIHNIQNLKPFTVDSNGQSIIG